MMWYFLFTAFNAMIIKKKYRKRKTENVITAEEALNRLFPARKNLSKTQNWDEKIYVSLLISQGLEITILPNSVSKHSPRLELIWLLM